MNTGKLKQTSSADPKRVEPQSTEPFCAGRDPGPPRTRSRWQMQALRAGQWEVYYDGDCTFCRRWAQRGQRWCHPQIQWRNFRELRREMERDPTSETARAIAHLSPLFDQAAYLIIARRLALPSFFAFRQLALVSPRLWPLIPLAYFPGSSWLGPKVYAWIARHYGPTSPQHTCQLR